MQLGHLGWPRLLDIRHVRGLILVGQPSRFEEVGVFTVSVCVVEHVGGPHPASTAVSAHGPPSVDVHGGEPHDRASLSTTLGSHVLALHRSQMVFDPLRTRFSQ